jgi:protein O-GlcNAc transferase
MVCSDFVEKLLYMPHTYQPQDHEQEIAELTLTREELGLPSDPNTFVFASFNRVDKVSTSALRCILPSPLAYWA